MWLQGNFPGEISLFSYCSIVFKRGTSTCLEAERKDALEEERICLRKDVSYSHGVPEKGCVAVHFLLM